MEREKRLVTKSFGWIDHQQKLVWFCCRCCRRVGHKFSKKGYRTSESEYPHFLFRQDISALKSVLSHSHYSLCLSLSLYSSHLSYFFKGKQDCEKVEGKRASILHALHGSHLPLVGDSWVHSGHYCPPSNYLTMTPECAIHQSSRPAAEHTIPHYRGWLG